MLGVSGGNRRSRAVRAAALALLVFLALTGTAVAAFPQDPPNDPGYDPAEEGGLPTCLGASVNDEQHYLFSNMPQCAPLATDPEGSSGMFIGPNAHSAPDEKSVWRNYTTGNPDTVIAYVEGGINWHNGDANELRNRVFLNAGELPDPTAPDGQQGLNADDYAVFDGTPTADANGNGVVDPEDIIVRFSDSVDDDGNGYTDDISGWDFYEDQNDPATVDSTYGHANSQMKQAAAETNNGEGDAGICPDCRLLPVKAGAEALDRTDDLAQAWLFADDAGADVIVSTTADLGYSSFMEQAVDRIWHDGVVMVESSNDFNSTDHQGGMFHAHVLPGNSVVTNSQGVPTPLANGLTTTYLARSSYPEWGTHNMFTAATSGGTTSESTPTVGGVMALVLAYSKEATEQGLIDSPLTGPEAIQVVRDTAYDISGNPSAPLPGWSGKPGFDLQYGYGRPNVLKAVEEVEADEIPPVGWIDSPPWYAVYNPNQTSSVPVSGHVEARRSSSYDWQLQYAAGKGGEPADSDFTAFASGSGTEPTDGQLASLDLAQIPDVEEFCSAQFKLSQTKALETSEQYTLTLRLQVSDADGRIGEERRAIAVRCDDSLLPGFPKRIGPGGEAQPVLADLQGTGQLAMIFGDSDGVVHAIAPSGDELPGWPVMTNELQVTKDHAGVDPGHEPILIGGAVGDLDHDGRQWVVATSISGRTYVWDAQGNRRPGWPKTLDTGVTPPPIPRPDLDFTREPVLGASAPPVLADLDGDGTLDILQAGWDGYLHAWRPNGTDLPGWPVKPERPAASGLTVINDQKLDLPPALAELDGDPLPELVQRTQYNETPGEGLQIGSAKSNLYAFNEDGSPVPGWNPSKLDGLVMYYGSAQEFITEGANAPVSADTNGDGKTETVAAAGIFSPSYVINPDGSASVPYAPVPNATLDLFANLLNGTLGLTAVQELLSGNLPTDLPVNFTTSGAFGRLGPAQTLSFAEPGSGAASVASSLLLSGSGVPITNYMRVHEAQSGLSIPGFPTKSQGLDFLGQAAIADVSGDGQPEVLEGGDSSALHAFTVGTGAQAPGFPKFTTGWVVFGPATGDLDSDGKTEIAVATREGYLMAWKTDGTAAGNDEWWNGRHDERNTGLYGLDTRPPGILRDATVAADGTLSWTAPGDEWYAGRADHYEIVTSADPITSDNFTAAPALAGTPSPAQAGEPQVLRPSVDAQRHVAIRAVDEAGNLGPVHDFDLGGTGGGGGEGSGGESGGAGVNGSGAQTGRRAAAFAKCKRIHKATKRATKHARRKCRHRARRLPL